MVTIQNGKARIWTGSLLAGSLILGYSHLLPALIPLILVLVLTATQLCLMFAPEVIRIGRSKRKVVESQRSPEIPQQSLSAKELRELSVMFSDPMLHIMADEAEAKEKAEAEAREKAKDLEQARPAYIPVTPNRPRPAYVANPKITPPPGGGGVVKGGAVTNRHGPKPTRSAAAITGSCYDLIRMLPDEYQATYLKLLGRSANGSTAMQTLQELEKELELLVEGFRKNRKSSPAAPAASWLDRAADHQRQELRRLERERQQEKKAQRERESKLKRAKDAQWQLEKLIGSDPGALWLIPEETPDELEGRLFNELCDLADKYKSPELHEKLAAVIDLESQSERLKKYRKYISILKSSNSIRNSTPSKVAEIKKDLIRKPLGGVPVVRQDGDATVESWGGLPARYHKTQPELDLEDIKRSLEAAGARMKRR